MRARIGHPARLLAAAAGFSLFVACSSGLEGDDAKGTEQEAQPARSTNLRLAFDPCLRLTHPISDFDLAGGVLPTSSGSGERPIAFFTFVTEAVANDGDGQGTPLDPDAPADVNAASDVFVAAIDADAVDERAFSYAIAGKMRHPRCQTCHQMNVDVALDPDALAPTAFETASIDHPRPPLGKTDDESCKQCHFPDWMAPAAGFDLRRETTEALFNRAQIAPTGLAEHFLNDPRVEWALGNGIAPFGNAADDDHDGVAEPEDTDGVVRTVPGGVEDFRRRFMDWEASGLLFDSADAALQDIALASREASGLAAANAASFAPSTVYVPNAAYVHGVSDPDSVPVGSLQVALVTDASDMAGGGSNGVTDVHRITLQVFQRSDGSVDLVYSAQILVSAASGGGDADGNSDDPDIGGPLGERVAFHSLATNLLAGGATPDNVYVHDVSLGSTDLVSHVPGMSDVAGNGPSSNPDLSPDGAFVAFESGASDLVDGDTNGVQDVFFADWTNLDVFRASLAAGGTEGSGGPSRNASIFAFPGGAGVRVAFESEKRDLVAELPLADTNVFLRDTRGGGTTLLLNQIVGPEGTSMPTATTSQGAAAPADAFQPVISPQGNAVLFVSTARDLDFVRPRDENRASDVVLVDLLQLESQGFVLPYALSVSPDGGHANGASHSPVFAELRPPTDAFPLGLAGFATAANNLGNSDPADLDMDGVPDGDNHMLLFLREGASVLAHFEARPAIQGTNLAVAFEDQSSGEPATFAWEFGDGEVSAEENPTHVYANPGFYSVSLEASGELGTDERTRTNYVRVLGPVIAQFLGTKDAADSGAAGQSAATNVPNATPILGALDDPDPNAVLRYDFDSAPSSELPDQFEWSIVEVDSGGTPIGTPLVVSTAAIAEDVTLDRTGFFDVSLAATGLGGGGQASQRLEVYQKVDASFSATTAVQGNAPLDVSFTDESTGDVASVLYDFDDSTTSSLQNPSHTFGEGVFNVSLTAFGMGLDQDVSAPLQIVALGDITANFTSSPNEAIASGPVMVSFTNTTLGTEGVPLFFHWSFGNGQVSTATNPSTSYTLSSAENRQQFMVTLVASLNDPAPANCGAALPTECDERSAFVTLFPALSVDFSFGSSFSSPATRPPHTVNFTGSVVGDGTGTNPTYQWFRSTPGGSTANILFSSSLSPSFEFPDPGNYRVFLRVSTDAPSGGRQSVDSTTEIVGVTASTFSSFFNNAIVPSGCTSCHSGGAPPAGLDWSGPASSARARLVNVASGCVIGWTRVVPNDPTNSIVHDVLANSGATASGCQSMRVNLNSPESDHVAVLRSWILGGALNN